MTDQLTPKPRRRRLWLRILLGSLVVLVVLIIALPSLVSAGLGQGLIRNSINKSINGTVAIDDLSIGWMGGQTIKGFSITEPSGRKAVDVDVEVRAGLFSLLTGGSEPIDIKLSGTLDGEVRQDGSVSFGDLAAAPSKSAKPASGKTRKPGEPFRLPEIPGVTLNINGLTVNLKLAATKQTLVLDGLRGKVEFTKPDQPINIELHAKTLTDKTPGSLDITGKATGLFDSRGEMTLRGAAAKVDVAIASIPLPLPLPNFQGSTQLHKLKLNLASDDLTGKITIATDIDAQLEGQPRSSIKTQAALSNLLTAKGELNYRGATAHINAELKDVPINAGDVKGTIQSFSATIASDDLTKKIDLGLDGMTQMQGYDPSPLKGRLAIDDLFTPEGRAEFKIEKLTGDVVGKTIPTPMLQPALTKSGILASRDIGPTVDVDATFSSGDTRTVSITAIGAKAKLEAKALVNQSTGAITGTHLLLAVPTAHPDLIQSLTKANVTVDRPVDVHVRLTAFSLPSDMQNLSQYAATGEIKLTGPTAMRLAASSASASGAAASNSVAPMILQDARVHFDSPRLADGLNVDGAVNIDGAALTFNEKITDLFNSAGALAAANAKPVGTFKLEHVPSELLVRFAPDQKLMLDELFGSALNATLTTELHDANLTARLQLESKDLAASLNAIRKSDALSVTGASVTVQITPLLAAIAQKDSANPVVIKDSTTATIEVQPFDLPVNASGQLSPPTQSILAAVSAGEVLLAKAPGIVEPVMVADFAASIEFTDTAPERWPALDQWRLAANGDVSLRQPGAELALSNVRFRINSQSQSGRMQHRLSASLGDLSVPQIEQVLGQERGTISDWTGATGAIGVTIEGGEQTWKTEIHTQLPNLSGNYLASLENDTISVTSRHGAFVVSSKALEKRMNATPTAADETGKKKKTNAAPAPTSSAVRVEADVPMELEIKELRFPLTLLQGKPVQDPKAASIDLTLTGGPVKLVNPGEARTTVSDLKVALNCKNLADGLSFTINGKADAPAESTPSASKQLKPGVLQVNGTLAQLLSADSTLHLEAAKLQMTAKVSSMPTAIVDALADMQGLLVAAVGPQMNATFIAEEFSRDSGQLDARIETTNGWLEGLVKGKEQSLRSTKTKPIAAELAITPALRERLLMKIHPILADIRTTEQPMRVKVPYAVVPIGGGDISNLKADLEMTVGKVEFDGGSTTMKLLSLFEKGDLKTVPGEIEPISASIRNGIVKYEKFTVHIDKYTMNYFGEINLVKGTADLHTELPLMALGQAVRELEPYADKIIVPLVMRGKFGELKLKIDPDFDMGKALLNAGVKGGIEDLFKGKGGGLLDDFLKDLGKKKE